MQGIFIALHSNPAALMGYQHARIRRKTRGGHGRDDRQASRALADS